MLYISVKLEILRDFYKSFKCLCADSVMPNQLPQKSQNVAEYPKDKEGLLEMRKNIAMELLWVQQAISSRKNVSSEDKYDHCKRLFSAPLAQVHYCDHVLSVVRLSSFTFHIFDFFTETAKENSKNIFWPIAKRNLMKRLTGSKISRSSTKFVFLGWIRKPRGPAPSWSPGL